MKVKVLVIALIVLVLLNLATLGTLLYLHWKGSASEESDLWLKKRHGSPWQRAPRELVLSPEQRKLLFQIYRDLRERNRPLLQEQMRLKKELINLLTQPHLDSTRVRTLLNRLSHLHSEIQWRAIVALSRAELPFTREQKRAFLELLLSPKHARRDKIYRQKYFHKPSQDTLTKQEEVEP